MKIAHVVLKLDCGGLEHLVIQLCEELSRRGVGAQIISLEKNGGLVAEAEKRGVKVFSLGKKEGFDRDLIFRLRKHLKEQSIDIVHSHNLSPLVYGTLAAKLAGIKCLNTRHGRADKNAHSLIWALNQYIVPVSEDAKGELLKNNSILNKNAVRVIYNGIDESKYAKSLGQREVEEIKRSLGIKPDSFVVGNVARLSKEKDHETLLKAFRNMIQKESKADLVIVGDGPLMAQLQTAAKNFKISECVKFLGYRDDVDRIIQIFDVFVISSFMEGIPLTVLEAMAARKPVIATKVGGQPEVVVEGETGFLVPCGFPERIETAIMRFHINRQLSREIGEKAYERFRKVFTLKKMTDEYLKLYQSMAKAKI